MLRPKAMNVPTLELEGRARKRAKVEAKIPHVRPHRALLAAVPCAVDLQVTGRFVQTMPVHTAYCSVLMLSQACLQQDQGSGQPTSPGPVLLSALHSGQA